MHKTLYNISKGGKCPLLAMPAGAHVKYGTQFDVLASYTYDIATQQYISNKTFITCKHLFIHYNIYSYSNSYIHVCGLFVPDGFTNYFFGFCFCQVFDQVNVYSFIFIFIFIFIHIHIHIFMFVDCLFLRDLLTPFFGFCFCSGAAECPIK